MVCFDQSRTMGEQASSTATSNYKNTIRSMKRLIGLAFDDPRAQAEMERAPYTCVPIPHADSKASIGVKVNFNSEEKIIAIEVVAGMMVKHMGEIVAKKSADSAAMDSSKNVPDLKSYFPGDWVVSVPAFYTDAQKRAFLTGCDVAGVSVQRLISETTATALAYGIFKDIRKEFANKDKPTHVMIIDLGATSYSVSVASFEPGKLSVKSSQFDADLGGREFDLKIAEWFAGKFEEKFKGKLSAKPMSKPKVALKILAAAEKAKKTLSPSGVKEVRMQMECIMDDLDFGITLKATEYEEICKPLLDRLAAPIQRALEETKLTASDLASIELVGGGTRVGCVKRTLSSVLGLDMKAINNGLSTTMNADEAVARGAALQSAILSPRFKVLPYEIIEYQPFPIKIAWDADEEAEGIEVEGQAEGNPMPTNSVIMFERGSNFPCVRRVTLRRNGDFKVAASYDETASTYQLSESTSKDIASLNIKAPAGAENKIRVNVKLDIHGCITLSSAQLVEEVIEEESEEKEKEAEAGDKKEEKKEEKKKKVKKTNLEFSVSRPMEMTQSEFSTAVETEKKMTSIDQLVRETADARNELESYIYDTRDRIISENQLKPYCTSEDASKFSSLLEKLENWLYEDGFDAEKTVYVEKLSELKKMGDPIEYRKREADARPNAVANLQKSLEQFKNWLNLTQSDEKYAHITDEERSNGHTKCDEASSWMYEMLDKQGSLSMESDPAFSASQVNAMIKEVASVVNPILNKPKPKPKPKEEPKASKPEEKEEKSEAPETPATEAADGNAPEPMDTSA